ncbi:MAG: phage tail protein, partial [Faecousia sp.]
MKHGIYVSRQEPTASVPVAAESGIPFVIGAAPVQAATAPAKAGIPVMCESWEDVVSKLGYSDDWGSYNLCEFAYSHFKLYGCKPVVFCNLLNPVTMKSAVEAADITAVNHQALLPMEAINDDTLVVKAAGNAGDAYVAGTDYTAYYAGENLIVELLEDGACYDATAVSVSYNKVDPAQVTSDKVAAGLETSELCMAATGHAPDLLCAPGYSSEPAVAAAMALKASGINGMFRAKALVDISTADDGAETLEAAIAYKQENLTDENMIVCWPMVSHGGRKYHLSTHLAGVMTQTDSGNDGCPYESPSSKAMVADAMVLSSGEEVMLSHPQANMLNANGIMTGLNFIGSMVAWGNYTAAYPEINAEEVCFIPMARVFDWVGNTVIRTLWSKLDAPVNRRLMDTVVDEINIWLNGLV